MGRVRPTNPLNSLPETCRSRWAAIQLSFVYTGTRPSAAAGGHKSGGRKQSIADGSTRSHEGGPAPGERTKMTAKLLGARGNSHLGKGHDLVRGEGVVS